MCITPKVLYIESQNLNSRYKIVVPCGHCRDCQNSKRAALVARFKNEQKYLPYVKFVTLTYSNVELLNLYYKPYYFLYRSKAAMLKKLDLAEQNNELFRYGKFLLNKDHAKTFCATFQKEYEKLFSCKVKYYLCGEYGTLNYRPHFHIAFFFQYKHTDIQLHDFIAKIWRYGDIQVGDCSDGGLNYVAKHCYKEDCGSEIQKKKAPIFQLQSRYHGGIGCNLANDQSILHNYEKEIKFGIIKGTKYKYSLPRYVLRKLHPERFCDSELLELEHSGLTQLTQKIIDSGYGTVPDDTQIELSDNFRNYLTNNLITDFNNKVTHFKYRFNKKYLANRKKYSNFVQTKQNKDD